MYYDTIVLKCFDNHYPARILVLLWVRLWYPYINDVLTYHVRV